MTAHEMTKHETPPFKSAAEVQQEPRQEQTDAEIEAWVMEQIRADKQTLDLLATL